MRKSNQIVVSKAEAGQKLLRFLERELKLPRPLLFRWLRSGEVRVNSGRSKADRVLAEGDIVRLPPQALEASAPGVEGAAPDLASGGQCLLDQAALGPDLPIVFQDDNFLALNKPGGLAVQGGSGITDSVAARLAAASAVCSYGVAPAHRLDKGASGLLLAGKSYLAQTWLHQLMRSAKAELQRGYLCWVKGDFSQYAAAASSVAGENGILLEDYLAPRLCRDGVERMVALAAPSPYASGLDEAGSVLGDARKAVALFRFVRRDRHPVLGVVSLVEARLLTGRKHQIRVQLGSRGFPLVGDAHYGGPAWEAMLLHAAHIHIPGGEHGGLVMTELELSVAPRWAGFFAVV